MTAAMAEAAMTAPAAGCRQAGETDVAQRQIADIVDAADRIAALAAAGAVAAIAAIAAVAGDACRGAEAGGGSVGAVAAAAAPAAGAAESTRAALGLELLDIDTLERERAAVDDRPDRDPARFRVIGGVCAIGRMATADAIARRTVDAGQIVKIGRTDGAIGAAMSVGAVLAFDQVAVGAVHGEVAQVTVAPASTVMALVERPAPEILRPEPLPP